MSEIFKKKDSFNQEKFFIRVSEASKLFSISQSHLWSLLASGQLNVYKPSPKITLIKVNELIEYIEQSREVI